MLVLSRKIGEQIQIGDDITVVVNRISGNRITLAIEAPRDVKIVRGELAPAEPVMASANSGTRRPALQAHEEPRTAVGINRIAGAPVEVRYEMSPFVPRNAR